MSRILKIKIDDADYKRLMKKYGGMIDIVNDIYRHLGIETHEMTDVEYIVKKIESFPVGFEFTYKDVFEEYPEKQIASNAKIVRRLCKDSSLVECLGYDATNKVRTYRRIEGDERDV